MFVACSHCGSWFRAADGPDDETIRCIYCDSDVDRRHRSTALSALDARYRDRPELRALLEVQQLVLEQRIAHEAPETATIPAPPSVPTEEDRFDLFAELDLPEEEDTPVTPRAVDLEDTHRHRLSPIPRLPPLPSFVVPPPMQISAPPAPPVSGPNLAPASSARWPRRAAFAAMAACAAFAVVASMDKDDRTTAASWSPPPIRAAVAVTDRPPGETAAAAERAEPIEPAEPADLGVAETVETVEVVAAAPAVRRAPPVRAASRAAKVVDTHTLLRRADQARRAGKTPAALALYDSVLVRDPGNSEALAAEGELAFSAGQFGQAARWYERALAANPGYAPALIGLGDAEWRAGDPAAARRTYQQALARLPADLVPTRVRQRSDASVERNAPDLSRSALR